jgi:hypothetical protein
MFGYPYYGFALVIDILSYIPAYVLFARVFNYILLLENLTSFQKYKRKMTMKLIKLGGRAQDLD